MQRAYYDAPLQQFLNTDNRVIIGTLTANSEFDVTTAQKNAWNETINILKNQLNNEDFYKFHIFFEFKIPRLGSRIDVLIFVPTDKPHLFVLEFKIGETKFSKLDEDQAIDYALELKNFHKASHNADIYPFLVASNAGKSDNKNNIQIKEGIGEIVNINKNELGEAIENIEYNCAKNDAKEWEKSPYQPTPTIIEAARALWQKQNVEEISRSDAGAKNITKTSRIINEIIDDAKRNSKKIIIFVTGVPGAGKTLVGLNIAAQRRENNLDHAVYLSGNGPLVAVLRESLARDVIKQAKEQEGITKTKREAVLPIKQFIQIIHHYRDAAIGSDDPPSEHIAIFDEAQRLWDEKELKNFMARKKNIPDYNKSEAQALIEYLDRHKDWAVCICLVGNGQEINKGEAGISTWIDAISEHFNDWQVCISNNFISLTDAQINKISNVTTYDELHLAVSMRSFRAENVSNFVHDLLNFECSNDQYNIEKYPICITRNLQAAKRWVREKARGSERYGIVASSKALRLKPFAIDMNAKIDPVHYFLENKTDPRSSYFLEGVASEFEVQGLELDYAIVCWDADLRKKDGKWSFHDFRGGRWVSYNNTDNNPSRQDYLKNCYRVLLTRARQGMCIFVPLGNYPPDETRKPEFYDETYNYLLSLGLKEIGAPFIDKGY